jgi:hypothetical protein
MLSWLIHMLAPVACWSGLLIHTNGTAKQSAGW